MLFGFVGDSYQSQSPLLSAESLINWYVEEAESQGARSAMAFYPDPGLSLDGNLSAVAGVAIPSVRAEEIFQGRTFIVAGTHLFERTGAGQYTDYGGSSVTNNNIVDDGLRAYMVAGGTVGGAYPSQILIASGGTLTVFSLVSNTFQAISTPPTGVQSVEFLDGFFIALSTSGAQINTFAVSAPEDATTWPGLSISQVSVFSDQLLSMIGANRLLWVFGAKRGVVYYNSGAPIFPFDVASGGFLEVGIGAQFSVARLATRSGTTIGWIGGDERGDKVVYVANGFTPVRVSDHALEYWMNASVQNGGSGGFVADAVGMGREDQGHYWYDLWFPTANATWTLDLDRGKWHRRSSLVKGVQAAHLGRCHVNASGTHLVGDRQSGNIYQMSINFLNENVGPGVFNPIIRQRIGPTIEGETTKLTVPINDFEVVVEPGLGPEPPLLDAFGQPRDPVLMFSYSQDRGKTFGPERMIPCGRAGDNQINAYDGRLGSWHSWTPKVTASDPISWRIVNASVNGIQDHKERFTKSWARIT